MGRIWHLTPTTGWILDTGTGRPENCIETWEEDLGCRAGESPRLEECYRTAWVNENVPESERGKIKARYPHPLATHMGGLPPQ